MATLLTQAVHKNNYVSGIAAGWLKKRCDWRLFFTNFCNFFSYHKKKVKKKKNCGLPTGFNFSHPLDRKQTFFYGQPHKGTFF